jgi:hypothetical protein
VLVIVLFRKSAEENGATLVMLAIFLPVLILFITFVVDVGNWFVHKRHLQMQADAGALAGGGVFTFPCSDDPIIDEARKYGGDPSDPAAYNLQIPPTDQANIHVLVNSASHWNEGGTDFSDGGPPCTTRFIDLKITEASLPWFFGLSVVPAINAHARVTIQALSRLGGALPVGVPDIDPKVAHAYFVDENNCTASACAVIASTPLTKAGISNGLAVWDNASAPLPVPISSSRIGVRIALGGGTSTTCGAKLVACYDLVPPRGILYVRGWSAAGSGAQPNPPLARDVRLFSAGCTDAYFTADSCAVGVSATVDFLGDAGGDPVALVGAKVSAVVAGVERPLTYNTSTGKWESTALNYFSVAPGAGPLPVELKWEEQKGTVTVGGKNENCTTSGGNKCKGTFGTVQRAFSAALDRSGAIKVAEVAEGGVTNANSFQIGTTPSLVVRIGVEGNLEVASSVSDPVVLLRVTGSQNQSVDCDPKLPNLRDEIRYGCAPLYEINEGTACPATANDLWQPQPPAWNCVAVQTGGAVGQVEQGLRDRVHGGSSSCVSPNHWPSFPNLAADDPRIVPVFVTPFGTFEGSGNEVVPVSNFGTFYITGWHQSPCTSASGPGTAADDPVPDKGYIVGHFIKYVFKLNDGGGSDELCDFNAFGSCIAVMTD